MLVQPDLKDLSIRRQCELLSLTRSMLYYLPAEVSGEERALMKEIDRLYTAWPFYGSRKILDELRKAGHTVNRKRTQRLMQVIGLQAMVPGPHTSKPHPDHPIYPYCSVPRLSRHGRSRQLGVLGAMSVVQAA